MRLPRVRFTVRAMMAATAIVAAVMGGWIEFTRLRDFSIAAEAKARGFRNREFAVRDSIRRRVVPEARYREQVTAIEGGLRDDAAAARRVWVPELAESMRQELRTIAHERRIADYCAAMRRKYEEAADAPWRSIDPDPPGPER
jgi:hypothetical protein